MVDTPEVWLEEFQVNTIDSGPDGLPDQRSPVVIQLDNGNIVVLYEDISGGTPGGSGDGTDIVGQIFDPLGNKIGDEFRANSGFTVHEEFQFDAAALPGGSFVVVYVDSEGGAGDGYIIRSTEWDTDANGVTSAANRTIATSPDAADIVQKPAVDAFSDGSYVVAFEDYDDSAVKYQAKVVIVSNTGTVGSEISAITGSDTSTDHLDVTVLSNGNMVVVNEYETSESAIVYRVLDSAGGSVMSATFVSNTFSNALPDSDPSVIALEGGGFVVAWEQNNGGDVDVVFQRYDNAGAAQGGIVTVNGTGTNSHTDPHLIALADGGFVVTYDDNAATKIQAQRFDETGTAVGNEFEMGDIGSNVLNPAGIGLEDGRFIVTWQSDLALNFDIQMKIFDVRDAPNAPGVYTPETWQVGTAGDDVFTAALTVDLVHGGPGNDTITEAGNIKSYFGDDGDDWIIVDSPINSDFRDGGDGIDTLDWSQTDLAFFDGGENYAFDLEAGTATAQNGNIENFTNIENLIGTMFRDTITGSSGDNQLAGRAGRDFINGAAGNDVIFGEDQNDVLSGGDDNDEIFGGLGDDRLNGQDGDDMLFGDAGNDIITGGLGNDTIDGGGGEDHIQGFGGDDIIAGGANNDLIFGGGGADTINGGGGDDDIFGNAGNDTIQGSVGDDNINGGGGDDFIDGFNDDDTLFGSAGNDEVKGGAGLDTLNGGSGADTLRGEDGNDTLFGGLDNDLMFGGAGTDFMNGGTGNDTMHGNEGADTMFGFDGNDTMFGGDNGDTMQGGAGADTVRGGASADTVRGGDGDDFVYGDGGNDFVFGEVGDDHLFGGANNDNLRGGDGNDTLTGGGGNDQFRFEDGWDDDVITDFADNGLEKINMRDVAGVSGLGDLSISDTANGALIEFGANSILVEGVAAADLGTDDFLFAVTASSAQSTSSVSEELHLLGMGSPSSGDGSAGDFIGLDQIA